MNKLFPILAVGAGGAIGSILRYLLSIAGQRFSFTFPHGTLWANLLGCLTLGVVTALATETEALSPTTRLFLATGICGGFTTMSTFTYETFQFAQDSEYLYAAGYCVATIAGCAAMFYMGLFAVKYLLKAQV
ncbi:MAG: fluoride efflux transporter CrcB [Kiritimatiellia bacterium]|jgi:CrcB protein